MHTAQLMPLPLTVSCFSKIQIGFTFLVPAHPGSPGKGPLNGCVCVFRACCECCGGFSSDRNDLRAVASEAPQLTRVSRGRGETRHQRRRRISAGRRLRDGRGEGRHLLPGVRARHTALLPTEIPAALQLRRRSQRTRPTVRVPRLRPRTNSALFTLPLATDLRSRPVVV